MSQPKALLIGYGNPGRGDDGLGPAFAERVAARNLTGLTVDIDFQLMADHALVISEHDLVIFADAGLGMTAPFRFDELTECVPQNMGSHDVTPEAAVALAQLLFHSAPRAFVLAISGDCFGDIREGLSQVALANLDSAEAYFLNWYAEFCADIKPAAPMDTVPQTPG